MIKHTPGPWTPHNSNDADYIDIDYEGVRVCSISLETDGIAFNEADKDDTPEREVQERWANAHLIAAAPELLAACKAILERNGLWGIIGNTWGKGEMLTLLNPVRDAIAKAEGRTQ